jgi:hypothetical protein
MYYEDPWDDDGGLYIDLYPGLQHMDGKTAVTYVRYRDSEGDIGRIKRQQKFMAACMEKVMSPTFIPRIPAVLREVIDAVDTDMTTRQLLELAGSLKSAQQNGLETDMVPGYPLYIDEVSYWIPDIEELQYAMATGLGVNVDSKIKNRVKKIADEYSASIPDNVRGSSRSAYDDYSTSRHSSYKDDTTSKRSSYDEDKNSSSSNYNDDKNSSSYSDNSTSKYSSYEDDTTSKNSNYDENTTANNSGYNDSPTSKYSSYEEENYYKPSRPTYSDYSPAVENIKVPSYDDYYDDTPTRGGDTYKER